MWTRAFYITLSRPSSFVHLIESPAFAAPSSRKQALELVCLGSGSLKKKMFLKLCVSPKLFKRHFLTTLDLESYQFRCREMKFLALEANAGSGFPV